MHLPKCLKLVSGIEKQQKMAVFAVFLLAACHLPEFGALSKYLLRQALFCLTFPETTAKLKQVYEQLCEVMAADAGFILKPAFCPQKFPKLPKIFSSGFIG